MGEPLNPEAWNWYYKKIGRGECPIVDTWWQTETGGILITPLPGAIDIKPAMATVPFFGVEPSIVDDEGKVLEGVCDGNLCINQFMARPDDKRVRRSRKDVQHLFRAVPGQILHR